jgi:hypothetical protein
MHRNRGHTQVGSHLGLGGSRDEALLLLHDGQAGHHRGILLVGRVLGHFLGEAGKRGL